MLDYVIPYANYYLPKIVFFIFTQNSIELEFKL